MNEIFTTQKTPSTEFFSKKFGSPDYFTYLCSVTQHQHTKNIKNMKTTVLDEATKARYRDIYYRMNILFVFWTLLLLAQLYSQKGYESSYIDYTEFSAFLIYAVYGGYQTMHNKGFYKYVSEEVAPYYTWKSTAKKVAVLLALIIGAALVALRFLLPEQTIYYMQNIFYVSAFLVPIYGVMTVNYSPTVTGVDRSR